MVVGDDRHMNSPSKLPLWSGSTPSPPRRRSLPRREIRVVCPDERQIGKEPHSSHIPTRGLNTHHRIKGEPDMTRILITILLLCLVVPAAAHDVDRASRDLPAKASVAPGIQTTPLDSREGGETIETAVPISGLPYIDTGSTCDNLHDYDEACTYTGSLSPDVVYSYTPAVDMLIQMDLCQSSYDTKIYVYDSMTSLVGCNDDFWFSDTPECFTYSSYLEVVMVAGETYYIVVDGYGSGCGDYVLAVDGYPYIPCEITCNDLAQPEGEPDLYDNYVDVYNGGCNSDPAVFQTPNWIDWETGCMNLTGRSGWYSVDGSDNRDTDWYEIVAMESEVTVRITTDNEITPTRCMMTTANPSCEGYDYSFETSEIAACQPMEWTVPTTPGATYWVFVAPAAWVSGLSEFNYCLEICGLAYDIVPTEPASWGEVKSLYR